MDISSAIATVDPDDAAQNESYVVACSGSFNYVPPCSTPEWPYAF